IILQAWLTLPSCLASSSRPTLARMIFCSVVMVSSNAPSGALRHPDRSAPRLGSRFAVGTGHLCQIKFWLMQTEASPSMGAWQGPLANGWHQQPKAVTRRSTANIAQLNQGSPSQTLRQRLRVALCTNGSSQSLPYFHEAYLVAKVIGPTPKPTLTHLNRDIGFWASPVDVRPVGN